MPGYLVNLLAPHYCCSCGEVGAVLCERCNYNIVSEPYEACMLCHKLAKATENLCATCKSSFTHAWVIGGRTDVLKKLIDDYKFERVRAAYVPLAGMLDVVLPQIPADTIIVPVPTIAGHVRVRGYDHARLIAREFARIRGLPYSADLRRRTSTIQRGADRATRKTQAMAAFVTRNVQPGARYLVVDDVATTGATVEYAAQALLQAGASDVWVAVVAAQPLEK